MTIALLFHEGAHGEEGEWQAARTDLIDQALNEFDGTEAYDLVTEDGKLLMAICIIEKRIQMAEYGGCKYIRSEGGTMEEHLEEQLRCYDDVGYTKEARQDHGIFCGGLLKQYFKASGQKAMKENSSKIETK